VLGAGAGAGAVSVVLTSRGDSFIPARQKFQFRVFRLLLSLLREGGVVSFGVGGTVRYGVRSTYR